jgi:hypothetical protein
MQQRASPVVTKISIDDEEIQLSADAASIISDGVGTKHASYWCRSNLPWPDAIWTNAAGQPSGQEAQGHATSLRVTASGYEKNRGTIERDLLVR